MAAIGIDGIESWGVGGKIANSGLSREESKRDTSCLIMKFPEKLNKSMTSQGQRQMHDAQDKRQAKNHL